MQEKKHPHAQFHERGTQEVSEVYRGRKIEIVEIDHLVYHLYNLTYDEVLIIDPETPITHEEYENYKTRITKL